MKPLCKLAARLLLFALASMTALAQSQSFDRLGARHAGG